MSEEKNELSPKETYEQKKLEKEHIKNTDRTKDKIIGSPKNFLQPVLWIVGIFGISFLIFWALASAPQMPPITSNGHIEDVPIAHIITTEMPDKVQRHMLEHADGNGLPSVVIQYNCTKYKCSNDLVTKLTKLVKEFPKNVYLAPDNKYTGKIILTREGRRLILNEFNEQKIRDFLK